MENSIGNNALGIIISIIPILPKILNGEYLPKKEWILNEQFGLFKELYLYFKPLIDIIVPMIFFIIMVVIEYFVKENVIVIMVVNTAVIVILEVMISVIVDTQKYIYRKITNDKIRKAINIFYCAPAGILTVALWLRYMKINDASDIATYVFLLSCFSYLTYLEPVNRKRNKYVDIFTDTRKSYLNVECENISQKGQWYFIKEGDTTRKIRKERVSEFVCHD